MCRCGLNHRGWESHLCRIELAQNPNTNVPALLKQTILSDPGGPVSVKKAKKQEITGNAQKVTGNAQRQAALKKKRIATGLLRLEVWAHPDDHATIKKYAKELADKRC